MRIERRYTKDGQSAYAGLEFRLTTSEIRNPDGSVVFKLDNVEVPDFWSQVASDVLAQKYFRKAGVAARLKKVEENTVPSFLWRSVADEEALSRCRRRSAISASTPAQQVFDRLAGTWTYWGWKGGYFDTEDDAQAFFDELRYMLAAQICAPNSPQWFNTGLHWAYGIDGPSQGHYYVDFQTGKLTRSKSSYEHPQPHACFIQGITDDLVNEGGIMDLWVREARLFKYGSGTGSNFSALRGEGEKLSGGGKSSGLMSFLKIGDRAAGAIKSGGTTRRAAKMVIVDVDHPDIETYIDWKVKEEQKVAALVTGSSISQKHLKAVLKACVNCEGSGDDCFIAGEEPRAQARDQAARVALRAGQLHQARDPVRPPGLQGHRIPDLRHRLGLGSLSHRLRAELQQLRRASPTASSSGRERRQVGPDVRKNGKIAKTIEARELWEKIGYAAWASRRSGPAIPHHSQRLAHLPGLGRNPRVQSVLGIHVPRRHRLQSGVAQPSRVPRGRRPARFDVESYEHAVRLWTVVLEVSVLMAQFPSKQIAQLSYEYRTLGLGYANIGGLLMPPASLMTRMPAAPSAARSRPS